MLVIALPQGLEPVENSIENAAIRPRFAHEFSDQRRLLPWNIVISGCEPSAFRVGLPCMRKECDRVTLNVACSVSRRGGLVHQFCGKRIGEIALRAQVQMAQLRGAGIHFDQVGVLCRVLDDEIEALKTIEFESLRQQPRSALDSFVV